MVFIARFAWSHKLKPARCKLEHSRPPGNASTYERDSVIRQGCSGEVGTR